MEQRNKDEQLKEQLDSKKDEILNLKLSIISKELSELSSNTSKKIEEINDITKSILVEVKKTNGRVTSLEGDKKFIKGMWFVIAGLTGLFISIIPIIMTFVNNNVKRIETLFENERNSILRTIERKIQDNNNTHFIYE